MELNRLHVWKDKCSDTMFHSAHFGPIQNVYARTILQPSSDAWLVRTSPRNNHHNIFPHLHQAVITNYTFVMIHPNALCLQQPDSSRDGIPTASVSFFRFPLRAAPFFNELQVIMNEDAMRHGMGLTITQLLFFYSSLLRPQLIATPMNLFQTSHSTVEIRAVSFIKVRFRTTMDGLSTIKKIHTLGLIHSKNIVKFYITRRSIILSIIYNICQTQGLWVKCGPPKHFM